MMWRLVVSLNTNFIGFYYTVDRAVAAKAAGQQNTPRTTILVKNSLIDLPGVDLCAITNAR